MSAVLSEEQRRVVANSFEASVHVYNRMGTPLFAEFCRGAAQDEAMLALADQAMEGARSSHLFSAVHYLLLKQPDDPLARYFATLSETPLPPEGSYPELARFCRTHGGELAELLRTRSVQTTYAERCRAILPPMCEVAREAGEPLNLVEIGCSAGVLLVFDKFAYRYNGGEVIGSPDAPFVLEGEIKGAMPDLFIPQIGKRTGIDLHTIDARSEEERRWLLGLCFPELRGEQQRLAQALDVIGDTDITLLEGDGLSRLAEAFAANADPLCVYHSACLFYWPREARRALEEMFLEESRKRPFWRIGIEPSDDFDDWHKGRTAAADDPVAVNKATGEISIWRYQGGAAERRVVGYPNADYGVVDWLG